MEHALQIQRTARLLRLLQLGERLDVERALDEDGQGGGAGMVVRAVVAWWEGRKQLR